MIKSVSKEDSDILNRIMEKIKSIEQDKADLEKKNVELKESKDKLVKSKKALTDSINQISSSKKELDAEVAECNAAIRELSKKSTQYMESIDENRELRQLSVIFRQRMQAQATHRTAQAP